MGLILNKIKAIWVFVFLCLIQHAKADDQKLKRSCLKENPIMQGVYDPDLIDIYKQACDKKNKENKVEYLIEAAHRFNMLDLNYHALQVIGELEANNIKSQDLTDLKFLAGSKLASDALNTMREDELRYLSKETTYPAAKKMREAIQHALPRYVLVEQVAKADHDLAVTAPKAQQRRTQVRRRPAVVAHPKAKPAVTQSRAPAPVAEKSTTPFSKL